MENMTKAEREEWAGEVHLSTYFALKELIKDKREFVRCFLLRFRHLGDSMYPSKIYIVDVHPDIPLIDTVKWGWNELCDLDSLGVERAKSCMSVLCHVLCNYY